MAPKIYRGDGTTLMARRTEIFDGNNSQRLQFDHAPGSVKHLSLSIDGLTIPPLAGGDSPEAGYRQVGRELQLRGYVFSRREKNIIVTFEDVP